MPQLDISSYPSQLFWLTIAFVTLFFILLRVALPRVAGVLQDRQQTISNNIDSADSYKEEAEELENEYNSSLKQVRQKASKAISSAHQDVQKMFDERHGQLDKILAEEAAGAEEKLNKSRDDALSEISDVSTELSRIIVEKISGIKVKDKEAAKAVAKLIN